VHRKRPRLRHQALALLTGALLTGASLTLAAPTAGAVPADPPATAAPAAEDFQQVTLAKGEPEVGEPMTLSVLPDRSVLHTSRDGTLRLTDAAGNTKIAGKIPVYTHDEEGLQGVAIDPKFSENRAIFLYYAPPLDTPAGDAPENGTAEDFEKFDGVNRLSRFVLKADGTLVPRRRRHRLRQGRQPLPLDGRRLQPLRLGRLHAHRRTRGPQPRLRRPARRRQHQRPARQDPAHQGRRRRLVHGP
jgi:hypothetical protein